MKLQMIELTHNELRITLNALEVLLEITTSPDYEIASELFDKLEEVNNNDN